VIKLGDGMGGAWSGCGRCTTVGRPAGKTLLRPSRPYMGV